MEDFSHLMAVPDHPVWIELEKCFRTRIAAGERQRIVQVIRQVLAQAPQADLNDLVIQVTQSVLSKSRRRT